jgi:kinesin family protein 20
LFLLPNNVTGKRKANDKDPTRPHMPKPPHIYSFDHVFAPSTSQTSFFAQTTLPLVSNSGKTYSISGANNIIQQDRGVLPRAIDVVYNSIAGLESKVNVSDARRFVMLELLRINKG